MGENRGLRRIIVHILKSLCNYIRLQRIGEILRGLNMNGTGKTTDIDSPGKVFKEMAKMEQLEILSSCLKSVL